MHCCIIRNKTSISKDSLIHSINQRTCTMHRPRVFNKRINGNPKIGLQGISFQKEKSHARPRAIQVPPKAAEGWFQQIGQYQAHTDFLITTGQSLLIIQRPQCNQRPEYRIQTGVLGKTNNSIGRFQKRATLLGWGSCSRTKTQGPATIVLNNIAAIFTATWSDICGKIKKTSTRESIQKVFSPIALFVCSGHIVVIVFYVACWDTSSKEDESKRAK
jgi:hypothetical protein